MKKLQTLLAALLFITILSGCSQPANPQPEISEDAITEVSIDSEVPGGEEDGAASEPQSPSEILPGSDKNLLTEDDLAGLDAETLRLAKNEIFARYGYVFKDEALAAYFNALDWYVPDPNFSGDVSALNAVEKKNVELIEKVLSGLSKTPAQSANKTYYILPDSNTRLLKDEDVNYMDEFTLRLAKNEIFARHGYVFKDTELASYFNNMSWYKKDSSFSGDAKLLSQVERDNVDFLEAYQVTEMVDILPVQTIKYDLDGDGKLETITAEYSGDYERCENMVLTVTDSNGNSSSIKPTGAEWYSRIYISKFDVNSKYSQIHFDGSGGSLSVIYVYGYKNGKLTEEGISGLDGGFGTYDGTGRLTLEGLLSDYVNCEFYFDKGVTGLPKSNIVGKTIDAGWSVVLLFDKPSTGVTPALALSSGNLDNPDVHPLGSYYSEYFVSVVSGENLKVLDWVLDENGLAWTKVRAENGKEGWYSINYSS